MKLALFHVVYWVSNSLLRYVRLKVGWEVGINMYQYVWILSIQFLFHSFVWTAAGKQQDLEQRVGVGGYGYPALVALNVKKAVYAPLKSAFELEHIV